MGYYILSNNLTRGEIRPLMHDRIDLEHRNSGFKRGKNFKVIRYGGARKRAGTRFLGAVKYHDKKTIVRSFEYNTIQTYSIEVGHEYFRVYTTAGRVGDVEVATPYQEEDIEAIKFKQSNDTLYLTHPKYPPHKILRTGHENWSIEEIAFTDAPSDWADENYPSAMGFYEERTNWGGVPTRPQTIWFSKAGDFENFEVSSPTVVDDAIEITILSDKVNAINWFIESGALLVGTSGSIRTVASNTNTESLSIKNIKQDKQTNTGTSSLSPIILDNVVIFAGKDGRTIRELVYSFESDGFVNPEISTIGGHVVDSAIKSWAWLEAPDRELWMALENGSFCCVTYDRDQKIAGFHGHEISGAKINSCCSTSQGRRAGRFVVNP